MLPASIAKKFTTILLKVDQIPLSVAFDPVFIVYTTEQALDAYFEGWFTERKSMLVSCKIFMPSGGQVDW